MTNYIEIAIETGDVVVKEILIAQLNDLKFEGFEETETGLKAFTPEGDFDENNLTELLKQFNLTHYKSTIESQNWNALWESNFEPVVVDDFCEVRADFHTPSTIAKHDIIITPKMSFGTGHHATTYMMIQQMRDLDFQGKAVADFGTGTGILAILAQKLGSNKVVAIDYDEWSIQNAEENISMNGCTSINLQQADAFSSDEKFDIILANINKNVILENLHGLVFGLNAKAFLLISGILKDDEKDLVKACIDHNLSYIKTMERNNWISILFANK
ncbi:MAG TPA: 50S ribosomal protein L11 methyltransferase [Segetibacter sp.]|jgi:ribosomal protein L11 methyltransferase